MAPARGVSGTGEGGSRRRRRSGGQSWGSVSPKACRSSASLLPSSTAVACTRVVRDLYAWLLFPDHVGRLIRLEPKEQLCEQFSR